MIRLGTIDPADIRLGTVQPVRLALGSVEIWSAMDADAAAYIAAVEAAGATVSAAQKSAIEAFIASGKADGWWGSIKRLYLPIWAAASPNAVCMVSRTSGAFSGTVTHGAGYVQGNGTSGYFAADLAYGTAGLSAAGACLMILFAQSSALTGNRYHGLAGASTDRFAIGGGNTSQTFFFHPSNSDTSLNFLENRGGVMIGSSTAINSRFFHRRVTSGISNVTSSASDSTSVANIVPYFMARNSNGTASLFANEQLGAYGYGLGISTTDAEAYSLALKTLWETCTGLTLP